MRDFFRSLAALITALLPFVGFSIVILFILSDYDSIFSKIICIGIFILSLYVSRYIFLNVRSMGYFFFISRVSASPDVDNYEFPESDDLKIRKPIDLAYYFKRDENLCKGGSLRIYGDFFGHLADHYHKISGYEYFAYDKRIVIHLNEGERLEIYKPITIIDAKTYFKIKKATRIVFYFIERNQSMYLDYRLRGETIDVDTNWESGRKLISTSLGAPALEIT